MVIKTPPATPRKPTDPDDNIPCKTPSPRSSASQAPPNPRAVDDEPTPRVNPHASVSSHPFKGLSRKFMSKKATSGGDDLDDRMHKRLKEGTEKAKKLDLGPAQGVYDTVSVRERVRRWQAAGGGVVTGDDFLEMPPILPATPSPAAHRRGMSMSAVGELENRRPVAEEPLSPPPISKIFREGWDSASDGDRDAERRRARSKDRERKMKRRRDRERGLTKSSVATDVEIDPEARQLGKQVPTEDAEKGTDLGIAFAKQHYPEDNDGIRVTPLKVKRRGSSRKKKGKEKECPEEINLGDGVEPEEVPKKPVLKEPIKFEDTKSEPGLRRRSREIDLEGGEDAHKVEVKAWDCDDGIRIYTKKSKTPIIAARFSEGGSRNSVRRGEKSVRARKEEFEAEMRRERKAQKDFEELIRQQEKEDRENAQAIGREKDDEENGGANNIEESTIVDGQHPTKKWEDFDDGIRVRPLRTKGARRKRSPASSSTKRPRDGKGSVVEENTAEATAEASPEVERQWQLEESIRRIRELEREDREDREKREQLEREEYERREVEEREEREKRELEIKEKGERKLLRQRELERKELEREMERERQREKEREMARKREAERLKLEAEMQRRKQRRREKERERVKEREREKQRQEERKREKEKIRKMESMERYSSPISARQAEPESGSETESMSTTESDPESEKELLLPTKPLFPLETNPAPTTPTRSKSKRIDRPMTPEDPLLELLGRRGAKRGTSPQRIKPERRWMWEKLASGGETSPLPYKATTPSPDPVKRRGSRKVRRDDSNSPVSSPSPAPAEEEQLPKEEVRLPPEIPERPRRTKVKARRTTLAVSVEEPMVEAGKIFASAPATPVSPTEDFPPKRRNTKSKRLSALDDGQAEVVETQTDTPLSEPLSFRQAELSVDPAPRKKKSDISTGTFGPKLASATSSFFKAVKAEFQAELQAATQAAESTSSSEGEDLDVLNYSVDDSKPVGSIQEQGEGSDGDREIATGLVTTEGLTPPPPTPAAWAADTDTDTETETETETESESESETESGTRSESGSQTMQEQQPSANPAQDTEASSEPQVQVWSQPEPEALTEKKPLATVSRRSSGNVLLGESQTLLPKRSLRSSPSPPKPKRRGSKARSQGTRTPTSPTHGGEARSYTDNGSMRAPSDASLSTVKPLNIKPRDPSRERQTPQEQGGEVHYTPGLLTERASLKRKYTKHADLISILSASKPGKSLRSAARIGSHGKTPRKASTITTQDLMAELATEEVKYLRELRTLVEDVIPVLFQTVLERADDVVRRRSLSGGKPDNYGLRTGFATNPTRPIVDMGISLERLKTVHERMPKKNPNELLTWAMDARRVYEEYLSVWRMGFQDVVVTLAPDYEDEQEFRDHQAEVTRQGLEMLYSFTQPTPSAISYEGDPSTWAMPPPPEPMDEGEKVDVAFLLKRPLVRLKVLAKLFKRMNILQPSASAQALTSAFHGVVAMARRKIAEEKARIEDEAAASINVVNVSDIHSLLPRHDVSLDPTKRVRARDSFYMRLYHSSGRVLQRNVELVLRDPAGKARPERTEILVCQFGEGEVSDKWLLFAPIPLGAISARTGDAAGEIVVMVRGMDPNSQGELREILVLGSPTAAGFEWVQMLGLIPIPPEGPFTDKPYQMHTLETLTEEGTLSSRWQTPAPAHSSHGPKTPKALSQKSEQETAKNLEKSESAVDVFSFLESDRGTPRQEPAPSVAEPLKTVKPPLENVSGVEGTNEFKPAEQYEALPPDFAVMPCIADGYKFLGGHFKAPETKIGAGPEPGAQDPLASPPLRHSASLHTLSDRYSAPSEGRSPSLQRSRKASKPSPSRRNSTISDDSDTLSFGPSEPSNYLVPAPANTLSRTRSIHLDDEARSTAALENPVLRSPFEDIPSLSPDSKPEESESLAPVKKGAKADVPPPVPPHRVPTTSQLRDSNSPSRSSVIPSVSSNSSLSSGKSGFNVRRRTSSPLKHEYDPSSPSGSEPESEEEEEKEGINLQLKEKGNNAETADDESVSSGSEESSSEAEESDEAVSICSEEEDGDYPPPMLSIPRRVSKEPSGTISLPRQRPSSLTLASPAPTIQAPAPHAYKFRAWVFTWATNQWEKLHSNECRIVITSGHIEGFPSASPPSSPGSATPSEKLGTEKDTPSTDIALPQKLSETSLESTTPVFSLDLNPVTPVRRGTAVDVSIRTPPNSKFSGASLMLRCRSPAECETLYNAINNSRVYPVNYQVPSTLLSSLASSEMGISEASSTTAGGSVKRGWGSWGRSKTYRNGIADSNPGSIISSGPSETSVGSLSSAFSRFRQHNRMFKSPPLSSVASSSSSNAGDSRGGSPSALSIPAVDGNPVFKIRLYRRENASKWRDLGNSRLNILKPPNTGQRQPNSLSIGEEKRIIVTNKAGTLVFLDEVLGESSFERVARTGIAVSVLVGEGEENGTGVPGGVGGIGAKSIVYMMQMKGEAEAAYTFSIVGKLRY